MGKIINSESELITKAEALRAYARQAKDRDMEVWAAEIRLRASRRAGTMLTEDKGLGSGKSSRLELLKISRKQSFGWQRMSRLPDEEFDSYVTAKKASDQIPTLAEAVVLAALGEADRKHRIGDT